MTHRAIATTALGRFEEITARTPSPGPDQVLIKVKYAAMIAFDTYMTDFGYVVQGNYPVTLGFSASGVVEQTGQGVADLKTGDRVAAFAFPPTASNSKAMQEFMLTTRVSVAKLPENIDLAEAATLSDNFITAFYTISNQLKIALPTDFPASEPAEYALKPILVYGAGSSVGQYVVQILAAGGYKNVIATASKANHELLKSLGASVVVDYRSSDADKRLLDAGNGKKYETVIDCICAKGAFDEIAKVVDPTGSVATMLPLKEGNDVRGTGPNMILDLRVEHTCLPKSVNLIGVRTFLYQEKDSYLKENLMPKILPNLLEKGLVKPNKAHLLNEGTLVERVAEGLDLLRNNKVGGKKIVVQIE